MSGHGEKQTVVLGVGNELYTDDGVGVVVARELAATDLPPGVQVIEGHVGGLNLLFDMENADHVIIVDAVQMSRHPGEVVVFTLDEVRMLPAGMIASLHHIALDQVLEFGRLMGITPAIHVVGIEPEEVAPGFALSDTAARAVPEAVAKVRQLLSQDEPALPELATA